MPNYKTSEKSRAKYQSLLRGGGSQTSAGKRPTPSASTSASTSQSKRRKLDSTEPNIGANESTREIIEKIFRQNSQINAKLDEILAKQQALEERIDQMEVDYEETNVDEAFANVIKFYIYITKLLCVY
jgi:hypothetical protein